MYYNIKIFIIGNLINIKRQKCLPFNDLSKSEIGNDLLGNESSLSISHNLKFGCQLSFACSNKYSVSFRKGMEKLQFCTINQFPRFIADCKAV